MIIISVKRREREREREGNYITHILISESPTVYQKMQKFVQDQAAQKELSRQQQAVIIGQREQLIFMKNKFQEEQLARDDALQEICCLLV